MTTLQISQSRIAVDWLCDVCRKLDVELDKHRSDVHLDLQQKFIKELQPKHDRSHETYYLGKVQSPTRGTTATVRMTGKPATYST